GPGNSTLPSLPSSRFRGRVIESTPAEGAIPPINVPRDSRSLGLSPTAAGAMRRSSALPRMDEIEERDLRDLEELGHYGDALAKEKLRDLPSSLPARRPGFFGRVPNPFAPRGMMDDSDSAIRAEPRTDPAADAALKRRIEKQGLAAVGDRVRGLDVSVV